MCPIGASVEHPISNIKVHGECNRGSEKLEQKMMPRSRLPENVSPYTGLRVPVCKGTHTQEGGGLMLQRHTMALVPCGNPTPKKLPTGGGEWPTFRTARAQRTVRPHWIPWKCDCASDLKALVRLQGLVAPHHPPIRQEALCCSASLWPKPLCISGSPSKNLAVEQCFFILCPVCPPGRKRRAQHWLRAPCLSVGAPISSSALPATFSWCEVKDALGCGNMHAPEIPPAKTAGNGVRPTYLPTWGALCT